jgi:dTDP-4-amino-4,6-dideoxygalactose transaminase
VDVDPRTANMDVEKLDDYLRRQCRWESGRLVSGRSGQPVGAIAPVHLYGQTAQMDEITALADEFGLVVIEDACQAHGSEYYSARSGQWQRAGSLGAAAAFSFYPGKNLGACGEGGAITTNDERIASAARLLREHGSPRKYHHVIEGYNGRLDAIQAAILSVKLKHLDEWNANRREAATRYGRMLAAARELVLPVEPPNVRAVYHLYVVHTQCRDILQERLRTAGIGTGIHYPVPLHLQDAYKHLGYKKDDFPVAEGLAPKLLSLPMFPGLRAEAQERVVREILAVVDDAASPKGPQVDAA